MPGRIDILVNNAGIAQVRMAGQDERGRRRRACGASSRSSCAPAAAPDDGAEVGPDHQHLLARLAGSPGQANYAASKGAVISPTRNLALEMLRYGITANCIAPALVDTPAVPRPGWRRARAPRQDHPGGKGGDAGRHRQCRTVLHGRRIVVRDRPDPVRLRRAQRGRRMRRGNRWR